MSLESWTATELSRFGYQNPKEIVSYLMESEKESSIEEYLNAILDKGDPEHAQFMKDFMQKYSELNSSLSPGFYRKPDIEGKKIDNSKAKIKEKEKNGAPLTNKNTNVSASNQTKKKTKFVSLYSEEGQNKDVILLSGRHKCDCQATKHNLVNNCLKCGRIVCEQEGSGPCAFCQNLVISKKEQELISRGTKKSEALHNKLIHTKKIVDDDNLVIPKSLQKAIDHKNKLLEYDRTSEKRTKVYDDENDYFQSNSRWINPADREKLQKYEADLKEKFYDRHNTKYTIDLLGRKVMNEDKTIYNVDDPFVNEILGEGKAEIYSYGENEICQLLNLPRPVYVDTMGKGIVPKKCDILQSGLQRLQDKELKEMRDEGMCLSMHQPWASLLIAGIKLHEGRTWYHSHRGRLWIASTAKTPTPQEISQLEQRYRILLNDEIKFPQQYPAGCLLGCVDVTEVLPQEEYRRQFPEGDSESPYVFICDQPQEMILKFPMKGKHKIYKLEPRIHETAMKSLKMT